MSVPAMGPMRTEDWSSLVSSVKGGTCILMLGPDAFMGDFDGERLSILVGLAQFVKQRLGPGYADLDPSKPWSVAQVAVAEEDPYVVQQWVAEFYESVDIESTVLSDLATLPFQFVISTSPGLSSERAFRAAKPGTHFDFYDRTGPQRQHLLNPSPDAPVVYNLYGSLQQPSSLILSDTDRLDFLVSVIEGNPPLPLTLTSALQDPNHTFLFLGFNLSQWQLRILVHVLAKKAQRRYKSFALELQNEGLDDETRLFYKMGHKVHFFDMDLPTFVDQLRLRVGSEPAVEDVEQETPLAPDSPMVFLCHASEDKEWAQRLSVHLRSNGLRTWFDKESLGGGDRWNAAIEQAIEQDVEYFVVLQSATLKSKDVGYVNKEIFLALDRQTRYRAPRRFVIPTVLDDRDSLLAELSDLQFVDLTASDGMDQLVKEIKRDLAMAGR